jgi:RNA polymerase sigma factor (sigma-70 family)
VSSNPTTPDKVRQRTLDDWAPTRQSLLERLRDWEDQKSWREFFELYGLLIYTVALKAGLTEPEAQDVVQETVLSVAKKMPTFHYDPALGSFKGWLKQLIGWRINRQLEKRQKHIQRRREPLGADDPHTDTIEQLPDPQALLPLEAIWETEWRENLIHTALGRIRAKVNPKHYQVFQLYALQHRPLAEIRSFLGVSAATVYLAKHRVGKLLKIELRRLEQERS